jgi:hypothetical protein
MSVSLSKVVPATLIAKEGQGIATMELLLSDMSSAAEICAQLNPIFTGGINQLLASEITAEPSAKGIVLKVTTGAPHVEHVEVVEVVERALDAIDFLKISVGVGFDFATIFDASHGGCGWDREKYKCETDVPFSEWLFKQIGFQVQAEADKKALAAIKEEAKKLVTEEWEKENVEQVFGLVQMVSLGFNLDFSSVRDVLVNVPEDLFDNDEYYNDEYYDDEGNYYNPDEPWIKCHMEANVGDIDPVLFNYTCAMAKSFIPCMLENGVDFDTDIYPNTNDFNHTLGEYCHVKQATAVPMP